MRESLNEKCRLFIENRDVVKSTFPMENAFMHSLCASYFMNRGVLARVDDLKETRKMLKARLSSFSSFRGSAELSMVAMLYLDGAGESTLENAISVYALLKKKFPLSGEYLPVAAMMIARSVTEDGWEELAERSRRIYDMMKKEHPFLTSSEDCVFAVMLALSQRSDEEIIRELEVCYNILKERFSDRNAVQSLSHVLALVDADRESAADKCRDTIRLFDALKEKKHKYGTGYELHTLGVLATLPCGIDECVRDLIEVSDFLKAQKGYGFWGFDRVARMMHAAVIVTSEHIGTSETMENAAINSTVSVIAAQHAATCAAISVSIAASAARS